MKKYIFDCLVSSFSLFDDPLSNYVAMAIIGYISYKIAFKEVGELRLRGEIGSIAHWIIRFFMFVFIWFMISLIIFLVKFIQKNLLYIIMSVILIILYYILKEYAYYNPNCRLNKKIF